MALWDAASTAQDKPKIAIVATDVENAFSWRISGESRVGRARRVLTDYFFTPFAHWDRLRPILRAVASHPVL